MHWFGIEEVDLSALANRDLGLKEVIDSFILLFLGCSMF